MRHSSGITSPTSSLNRRADPRMTDSRRADPKRQPWSIDEGSTKVGRVPITLVLTARERRQSIDGQMRSAGPVKKQGVSIAVKARRLPFRWSTAAHFFFFFYGSTAATIPYHSHLLCRTVWRTAESFHCPKSRGPALPEDLGVASDIRDVVGNPPLLGICVRSASYAGVTHLDCRWPAGWCCRRRSVSAAPETWPEAL